MASQFVLQQKALAGAPTLSSAHLRRHCEPMRSAMLMAQQVEQFKTDEYPVLVGREYEGCV